MSKGIKQFLDDEGRVKSWPAKTAPREEIFRYLYEKFDDGRNYTEHEVNAILGNWHSFGDLFLLRRGLIESAWLMRFRDGSRYWKNPDKKEGRA